MGANFETITLSRRYVVASSLVLLTGGNKGQSLNWPCFNRRILTMAHVWNDKTNNNGSHLTGKFSLFLGEDTAQRLGKAKQVIAAFETFARDVLQCEIVAEFMQTDCRVSAYDAYRAAGVSHADALAMIESDKARAAMLAKGRAILKKSA